MREKEKWTATVEPVFFAQVNQERFSIKAALDREPGRDLLVSLTADMKPTARWLAQALLEWAGSKAEEDQP